METLLTLLTAHLLGDFVFQNNWMVRNKSRPAVLPLHVGFVVATTWMLLGSTHGVILATVLLSHAALDLTKVKLKKDGAIAFILDQAGHLFVIVFLAGLFPQAVQAGWWPKLLPEGGMNWYMTALCMVSGVILIAPAGGILIGKLTAPFRVELGSPKSRRRRGSRARSRQGSDTTQAEVILEGLKDGGKYIGWLERLLAVLLFLINQPTGIGFVIAAKSILRFGEIKESSHRKMAEYIIIGTFLSFGWALAVAVPLKMGIEHWSPIPSPTTPPFRIVIEEEGNPPMHAATKRKGATTSDQIQPPPRQPSPSSPPPPPSSSTEAIAVGVGPDDLTAGAIDALPVAHDHHIGSNGATEPVDPSGVAPALVSPPPDEQDRIPNP